MTHQGESTREVGGDSRFAYSSLGYKYFNIFKLSISGSLSRRKKREEHAAGQEQARDNPVSDRGSQSLGENPDSIGPQRLKPLKINGNGPTCGTPERRALTKSLSFHTDSYSRIGV